MKVVRVSAVGLAVIAAAAVGTSALAQSDGDKAEPCASPSAKAMANENPAPQKSVSAKHSDGSSETTTFASADEYTVSRCDAKGRFMSARTVVRYKLPSGRSLKFITNRQDVMPDGGVRQIFATTAASPAEMEAAAKSPSAQQGQSEIPEPTSGG